MQILFFLWNTFDYQFRIVWYTNPSFCPNHAAIVASIPLRGIYHIKKSHKSANIEHFYVLQRCIPYVNTLHKETEIKKTLLVIFSKILRNKSSSHKVPKRGGQVKAEVCSISFTDVYTVWDSTAFPCELKHSSSVGSHSAGTAAFDSL